MHNLFNEKECSGCNLGTSWLGDCYLVVQLSSLSASAYILSHWHELPEVGIGGRYWPVVDLHLKFSVCVDCEMLFE